jgi:hypothetical protein
LVGNNTDSVLRRFPVNVRFFVTFRFFLRLPGFNASLCLFFKFYQFFSSVNYISILVYRRTRPNGSGCCG